ncbi:MAG: hypothetical protein CVV00_13580 [Firmicutes bacterium HGW-Firmicutes-5]|jgi:energy-coupling factor transporter ATP-binding protein EcfA2|nr:MAG: hypothetical protein CVV00_13580 [Firmicutes bacterium HGW-Firmicutes-5]
MNWGYDYDTLSEYGLKHPIEIPIESHPHALITGASGSGKSTAVLYSQGSALKADPRLEITFADFKKSEEFAFLKTYKRYYAGESCYDGVTQFYAEFCKTREAGGRPDKKRLLIIDEYPAFISYMQTMDKNDKTKRSNEILSIVSEVLMLGRGLNNFIWIVCQRADSSWFTSGSRDNFMIRCCLGNISKEQKTMLFSGEELPERIYKPGQGVLHADGKEIMQIIFPRITDLDNWKGHILKILNNNTASTDDEALPRK